MTAPRSVVPGSTFMSSRRCLQRLLLLRPSREVNQIVLYVLALASQRYRVDLHAFCFMSNHQHIAGTDLDGRRPAFHQFLDALIARAVNASLGRWETFWAPDTYSAVRLVSRRDVIDKCAYVLANPVAAGLVSSARAWPGAWSDPALVGGPPLVIERPTVFFDPDGTLPERVTLQLKPPPGFTAEEYRALVTAKLEEKEEAARAKYRCRRGFLGVAKVLGQSPYARPRTREERRGLKPQVAARDKWKRVEALQRLKRFVSAYRAAWEARRAGDLEAVFPFGTYLLRVLHGVPCASAG